MKIVVCVKQVVDTTFPFVLDQETISPVREDLFYRVNPADLTAMEAALNIRETLGGEVILMSFGPERVERALRDCLAMGGDRAIRIPESRLEQHSQAKALLLAGAAATVSPDLVLCGARSLDEGSGETPAAIAEYLGFTQVTGVMKIELTDDGRKAVVEKKLEKGQRETIECPLPAVLSLESGVVAPRYAALPGLLAAHSFDIDLIDESGMEIDAGEKKAVNALRRQIRQSLPRPRPKKTFSFESSMTAEERMEMMMSGGMKKSSSDLLEGTPKELAEKLGRLLEEKVRQ